jgi:hypothetical protein
MAFPTDPAEFEQDERISWSKTDNCWILEFGVSEFHFDTSLKRWVEIVRDYSLGPPAPCDGGLLTSSGANWGTTVDPRGTYSPAAGDLPVQGCDRDRGHPSARAQGEEAQGDAGAGEC